MFYAIYYGDTPFTEKAFDQLSDDFFTQGSRFHSELKARYCYIIQTKEPLDDFSSERVSQVLSNQLTSVSLDLDVSTLDQVAYVLPRKGTISVWSSQATNVFHVCQLTSVLRVERGIVYCWPKDLDSINLSALFDPMLEDVYSDYEALFEFNEPKQLKKLSMKDMTEVELSTLGIHVSPDELAYLKKMYEEKLATDVELMMFAQANSEHCRHKIFNALWVDYQQNKQALTLFKMIKKTSELIDYKGILSAYSDNASVIEGHVVSNLTIDSNDRYYRYESVYCPILMKVETHNHPTAISPFSGAATGIGGEIRDEAAVGRGSTTRGGLSGYVTSHLRMPNNEESWESFKMNRPQHFASALDIMLKAPIGAARYGNEFGRPNILGYFRTFDLPITETSFIGYHKPIMIAGGMGHVLSEHIFAATEYPENTCIIVLGGPSLLIGLGGSSASSQVAGSHESVLDFASVQRANPEMERRCQEVIDRCRYLGEDNPILLIHDVGAGGLSNAVPELLRDMGKGGDIQLRDIPSLDSSLSPLELWCNESQERYVLAMSKEGYEYFSSIADKEKCPYRLIGTTRSDNLLRVYDELYNNYVIDVDLEQMISPIDPPERLYYASALPNYHLKNPCIPEIIELEKYIHQLLKYPAISDKGFLIYIADRTVGGQVAQDQLVGPWQVPVSDVSVMSSGFDTFKGEAMAIGERPVVALIDPQTSVKFCFVEAILNLLAADISDLSDIKLSANWMSATSDLWDNKALYEGVYALSMEWCQALGVAIPVGKDSLSMETSWRDRDDISYHVKSPMSLNLFAFSAVSDVRKTLTPYVEYPENSKVYYIPLSNDIKLSGSSFFQILAGEQSTFSESLLIGNESLNFIPEQLKELFDCIVLAKSLNLIDAYHDVSDGGFIIALIEILFASQCGAEVQLNILNNRVNIDNSLSAFHLLFSEMPGCLCVISESNQKAFEAIFSDTVMVKPFLVGKLLASDSLQVFDDELLLLNISRSHLRSSWSQLSYQMQSLRDCSEFAKEEFDSKLSISKGLNEKVNFEDKLNFDFILNTQRPKVAILREQGINGHYEMAAAFKSAGFDVIDFFMQDLLGESDFDDIQVLAVCGGFSFGDALGAGSGWAKSILYSEKLTDKFIRFFERKDSLTLGVCNGCQMLSQLSSLIPGFSHCPVFLPNLSQQFEARTVLLKIHDQVNSPFLEGMSGSVLSVASSHGEGRVIYDQLIPNIAAQYVNYDHEETMCYPFNPNGSQSSIASVVNDSGNVLLMMPHPERVFRKVQQSWRTHRHAESIENEYTGWIQLFRNAYLSVK